VSSPPPVPGVPIPATPIEPVRRPGGCARGALIGCGAAAILVLILMAAFAAYARRKPWALTDLMMSQIERNFAPDVTEQEKASLRSAYAAFRERLRERRVGGEPFEKLRTILSTASVGTIGREQVRSLTEVFRSGAEAPNPTPGPGAAPAVAPTS